MTDDPPEPGDTAPSESRRARDQDQTRLVGRNSLVGIVCQVIVLVVGLFLTPYTLDHIGLTIFGLWSFIITAINYMKILNAGLGSMVTRFIASHDSRDDIVLNARVLTFGVLTTIAIGAVTFPFAILVIPILVTHLHVPTDLRHTALVVLYWGYAYFFATSVMYFFASALIGVGAAWLASVLDTGAQIVYATVVVVLLARGSGIYALLIANSLGVVGGGLVTALACHMRIGRIFANPFALERGLLRQIVSFSGWTQLVSFFGFLTNETDPFVLGSFVSVADVGIYSLAGRLAGQVSYLPRVPQNALMASAAAAHARGDKPALHKGVVDGGRFISLFGFSIVGALIALGPVIYRAWLGKSYPLLVPVMILLCLSQVVSNLAIPVSAIVIAMGEMRTFGRYFAFGAAINIAVTIALLVPLGFVGVVIGTLAGNVINVTICLVRFHRLVQLPLHEGITTWLWRLILAAAAGITMLRLVLLIIPTSWTTSRIGAATALVFLAGGYLVTFVAGLRVTRFFRSGDLVVLQRIAPARFGNLFTSSFTRRLLGTQ